MLRQREIRSLFEGRTREAMQHGTDLAGYRRGCAAFLEEFHDNLGVRYDRQTGRSVYRYDENERPVLGRNRLLPKEVVIRRMADALLGHDVVEEHFNPQGGSGLEFNSMPMLESALDPTTFLNVNVMNLAVAGLVNARILEQFDAPDYIGRNLITIVPTTMNGHKIVGVAKIAPQTSAAKGRRPGEQHGEVGFTEQYQTTPETVEQALKCVVTKEAYYFDQVTGQVLETAGTIGDELGYGEEKDIADGVMGVTNSYNFNGTAYNTYQTSSPWINDQSNPFTDELDVDESRQLFVAMTDPVTGREIRVNGRDILCMPARELKFRQGLFGSNVQVGTQINSNFPSRYTQAEVGIHKVNGGMYNVTALTAIWYNRATAADGLNLSASNAKEYWWNGDFKKAFEWHQNWPLTPWQAAASELVMKDRGLIAVYGANYRGIFYSRQPRYVVRNKN